MQAPIEPGAAEIESVVEQHHCDVAQLLGGVTARAVAEIVDRLHQTRRAGGIIYACGNGGSAATALHLCNDLFANGACWPTPLRVSCLSANISIFSALANDTGYENVFVKQLECLEGEDTVIAISASGNSENCVRALEHAASVGAGRVALVGFDGGRLADLAEHRVHVPRHDYLAVEDVHAVLCHAIARGLGRGAPC